MIAKSSKQSEKYFMVWLNKLWYKHTRKINVVVKKNELYLYTLT